MFLFKVDGCTNHTVLYEKDHAQGDASSLYDRSDNNLVTGWYRFQGAAVDRMADKCAFKWHCSTEHPGWLCCASPIDDEDEVKIKVCYANDGECCGLKDKIKVRRCSGYYVHELKQTLYKYWYCGNADAGKLP